MPFGSHLAADTLPSENCKRWLQVHLGRVRLSPSCPFRLLHTFLSPGPRGITPAFGYGAPHPSARGTSTLLNNALLSAHYGSVRLPTFVHHRRVSLDFPTRPGTTIIPGEHRTSRFPHKVLPYVHRVSDRAGPRGASRYRRPGCCLPLVLTASASRSLDFTAEYPARTFPLSTLRRRSCKRLRMTRGRRGSLTLQRMTPSFTTPRRF